VSKACAYRIVVLGYSVCRFYGSVSPGPNSHFFTADQDECVSLRKLAMSTPSSEPRWNSEGSAFNVFPPVSGSCEQGKVPVWRVFNGGWMAGVEPNHRYSTDAAVINDMIAKGWKSEGLAFCADSQ
jgi:hypothetical protein